MPPWLRPALDYLPLWLDCQMRHSGQPGCLLAVAHRGRVVLERAWGHADLARGEALTPRHRFRIASHSKSFTAAGIMKLRERGRLGLDDPVGDYVDGLHPAAARATIGQVLSHSAGLVRDGADGGQFQDRRPFLDARELLAELRRPPPIERGTRLKYSNHGYGLLGLVIERATGEPYRAWIEREIVAASGLAETAADMPLPAGAPFARGHSGKLPLGDRAVIPGDFATRALAPAAGFVSTAADVARFFCRLAPGARGAVLSPASRREMARRHWRNQDSSLEGYYGLGLMSGSLGGWDWFGHTGGLQGYVSRTAVLPRHELAIAIFTNAIDGWAGVWVDGAIHILRAFAQNGPPTRATRGWSGRWWTIWGPVDLVAMGGKVLAAAPAWANPFLDASEIAPAGRDRGTIALAGGYGSPGEPVRLVRDRRGRPAELWLAATRLLPRARVAGEMRRRYRVAPARARP